MSAQSFPGSKGTLTLNLGWKGAFMSLFFVGGPYDKYPGAHAAFGVCVRAEKLKPGSFDVLVPINDFDIPRNPLVLKNGLCSALEAALGGRPVYVGCMGGFGRTGLFLAILAKVCGVADPVAYVRKNYYPRAVETLDQEDFVKEFDVGPVRNILLVHAWKAALRKLIFWK